MRTLASFVKQWLVPGTMPFLLLGLLAGGLLLNAGPAFLPAARAWLTAIAVLYWLLSLPAVAAVLINGQGRDYHSIIRPEDAAGSKVLVVVGNGSVHYSDGTHSVDFLTRRSVFCVFEAARLYQMFLPDRVIATGGDAGGWPGARPEAELIRELAVACGVPCDAIIVESGSRTTAEQVANVIELLSQHAIDGPIVVVTTSAHMPRVAGLFTDRGVRIVPAITPELRYDEGRTGWRRWWPSMAALTGSASAMYELMARVYASPPRSRSR
jgi:uncharacterized SAM-binding protein YcdF (DUF218 family)